MVKVGQGSCLYALRQYHKQQDYPRLNVSLWRMGWNLNKNKCHFFNTDCSKSEKHEPDSPSFPMRSKAFTQGIRSMSDHNPPSRLYPSAMSLVVSRELLLVARTPLSLNLGHKLPYDSLQLPVFLGCFSFQ